MKETFKNVYSIVMQNFKAVYNVSFANNTH